MNAELRAWLEGFRSLLPEARRKGAYRGIADLMLQHALDWEPYSSLNLPRGEPQQCFANAQRLALAHRDLTYVEGYALSVIPIHHGWCVDPEGRVVDVTWTRREEKPWYCGVPIRSTYVSAMWLRTGHAVAVFDNWEDSPPQPILAGRHRESKWLQTWPPTAA